MTATTFLNRLKKYKSASKGSALRKGYLKSFLPKMMYRTTKTENPETTQAMVNAVLRRDRT